MKYKTCPHCNGKSFEVRPVAEGPKCMISCGCGHISKIFGNEAALAYWWNTRGGRKPSSSE